MIEALKIALEDMLLGTKKWRLWVYLANHDLIIRYKRSWLGITWVLISFSLFVITKVAVFGVLAQKDLAFFSVYLSVGFMTFKFISAVVIDGANALTASEGWIKGESLPLSIYIYRAITRNLIVASYTAPPVLLICIYFNVFSLSFFITIIPVLLTFCLNAVWISGVLAMICARHRDLSHLVSMGMSMTYFLTPVLWVQPETGLLSIIAKYNPFTYFIDILRAPLLEQTIPFDSWAIVGGITGLGFILLLFVFGLYKNKIIYWL
jgi:ABC-type polysaccharide/polyol phosphate export permease